MELAISFGVGKIEIERKIKIVKPFFSSISYYSGGLVIPKIYAF